MTGNKVLKTAALVLVFSVFITGYSPAQAKFGPRTEQLLKIFKSDTFHMKAKMSGGGQETDIETFVKGGMSLLTMSSGSQITRIIARDNKLYMIDESKKTITIIPTTEDNNNSGKIYKDDMRYTGSGTAVFGGRSLPYEEYITENDDDYEYEYDDKNDNVNIVQYFIDGNRIAGSRTITHFGNIDTVISVLDQNVPANVFNVPTSGYQIQDMPKGF